MYFQDGRDGGGVKDEVVFQLVFDNSTFIPSDFYFLEVCYVFLEVDIEFIFSLSIFFIHRQMHIYKKKLVVEIR